MKTYTVIKPDDERIGNKLQISTTDIISLLSDLSTGTDAIILPVNVYEDLVKHPNFRSYFATQCYVCPFSKCFLFLGKWWASEEVVSPLLIMADMICINKEKNID